MDVKCWVLVLERGLTAAGSLELVGEDGVVTFVL